MHFKAARKDIIYNTRNEKPSPVATSNKLDLEGLESANRRSSMDESLRFEAT